MANGYKYVCAVSALFRAARAFVRGPAQRIFCMPGTRYRSPGPHPPAGGTRARGHGRGRGAGKSGRHGSMFALSGPEGVRPRPGRVVGKQGWPGASRSGATRARVCRIKRVSVCPAAGEGSRMPIRVSAGPKAEERTNAGPPSAGCPACRDMRGSVNRTAPSACRKGTLVVGTGALPCLLPAKNEGSPERLPSPSKINP